MAERKQQPTTEVLVYKMKCTSRSQIQTQENKKANINVNIIDIIQTCYSIVFFDNVGVRSHIVK